MRWIGGDLEETWFTRGGTSDNFALTDDNPALLRNNPAFLCKKAGLTR